MEQLNKEQDEVDLTLSLTLRASPEPGGFFLCVYCHRKFRSSQALGGHQNAHKHERSLAKHRREIAAATRARGAALEESPPGGGDNLFVFAAEKAGRTMGARKAASVALVSHGMPRKRGRSSSEYTVDGADELDLSLRL